MTDGNQYVPEPPPKQRAIRFTFCYTAQNTEINDFYIMNFTVISVRYKRCKNCQGRYIA